MQNSPGALTRSFLCNWPGLFFVARILQPYLGGKRLAALNSDFPGLSPGAQW